MTTDSGILLKNHISYNFMLKSYITTLLRQFTKTLVWFLNLSAENCTNGTKSRNATQMETISKIQNSFYVGDYCIWAYNFYMAVISNETVTLNSPTLSIFPALEIKKLALVGKILWRFDIIWHIWLIHLIFH